MCRTTTGPLLAMVGVAGTAVGVGFALVREKLDRIADSRAAKQAADDTYPSSEINKQASSKSKDEV